MQFSRASDRTVRTNTLWAVHNKAVSLQAAGEDIILFSIGDPDLPTLDTIIDRAVSSLNAGRTHYALEAGGLQLRQTIANIETRTSGKKISVDQIVIHPGGTNGIYTALSCLLDEGDEIVTPSPMYVGYQNLLGIIGAKVVHVPLNTDDNFSLDVNRIKDAFTPNTHVLFLNTPGNPAGNMISADQLQELAEFCLQKAVWIICDEVYSMIVTNQRHVSLVTAAKDLENVVVIDSLSKSHAMTGWRVGWTISSEPVAERIMKYSSATVFTCCQFSQDAAAFALESDEEYIKTIANEYRMRRDYALSRIKDIPRISANSPSAGMFIMMNIAQLTDDGYSFADRLLEEEGVSVLPGAAFGEITRHFVRLSLTHSIDVMSRAFDRIERFVSTYP